MKYLLKSVALIFIFFSGNGAFAQDVFVHPGGDDANPGTKEKPVATLEAARDLIRQYKTNHEFHQGGLTVWIGQGQYDQTSPLVLNELDSGEAGAPVVWRAVKGEKVTITGGRSVPSEKFIHVTDQSITKRLSGEAADKVVQVNLKELGINDYGQIKQYGHSISVSPAPLELFFNQQPMQLAQYPNKGYLKIGKVLDAGSVPRTRDYSLRGAIFEYTDPRHTIWAGQKDIWLQGSFNYGFADDNLLIESIDPQKRQIKLAMPSLYGVAGGKDFQQYVAQNILDELDTPGEWFLDKEKGTLYFWPPGKLEGSTIMVSMLEEPIICLEGANYLMFRDVTVEVGRGIGIYIERGSHNLIAGCTVRNVGTSGIFMGQGAKQTIPYVTVEDYEGVPVSRMIGNLQGHKYKYTSWDRKAGSNHGILSCEVYNTGSGAICLGGGDK